MKPNSQPKSRGQRNKRRFGYVMIAVSFFLMAFVVVRLAGIMLLGRAGGQDLEDRVSQLYKGGDLLLAERGTIYDQNNNPIAVDAKTYKMTAILTDQWAPDSRPIHVQDPDQVARVLSNHLAISYDQALEKLESDASQVEFGTVGNKLSYDTVGQIQSDLEDQGLTGITFEENQSRLYPNGTFASNIIGLAQDTSESDQVDDQDRDENDQIQGVMGLEEEFNDQLTGENGVINYQQDRYGYILPNQKVQAQESVDGDDLHLTLDRRLQTYLENILDQVQADHKPKTMTATVMDAKNGAILASSQRPSFNATTLEGIDQSWQNLLVDYEIEPGSTLKVITLAAAIEEGVFDPNAYFESGTYEVAGGRVRDVKPGGWGTITYLEGLFRSSNVAFVKLVEAMGLETWKSYLDAFGFGQVTGIELPNERPGQNPYLWNLQKVNTAFGQGITVTPIQMLQAFTAISNQGEMVRPNIIKDIDQEGEEDQSEVETENQDGQVVGQPISQETAQKTLDYLRMGVESDIGTTNGYQIEGVPVAAKTGTAQIVNPETGQYYSSNGDYIYSVVTMLPADEPEYILYITVQQPQLTEEVNYGGQVVKQIFDPLSQRFLLEEGVDHGGEDFQDDLQEVPNLIEKDKEEALDLVEEADLEYSLVGQGDKIVQQSPGQAGQVASGQKVILVTNGAMTLPDLRGWSKSDLVRLSDLTGINLEIEGEGYVTSQDSPAQTTIESGDPVKVTMSDPSGESSQTSQESNTPDHPDQAWDESTFAE